MLYTYYKQAGNRIHVRYKSETDPKRTETKVIDTYEPTLWIESQQPSDVKSIYGVPLEPVTFPGIKEARDFAKQYSDVANFVLEGNSNYANQFIIELFDGKEPEFDANVIRAGVLDIEVYADEFPNAQQAKHPVTAITVWDSVEDHFVTFGLEHPDQPKGWDCRNSPDLINELNVTYFKFEDEINLLRSFGQWFGEQQFDVISGWNSIIFDAPYLVNRMSKLLGEKQTARMLSPFNRITHREVVGKYGKMNQIVDIEGLPHLDYMELYKKHIYTPRESYKLDFIAHAELSERKLSYDEAGSLHNLYMTDYQLYIDYNIQDVNIIKRLDAKLGLFSLTYTLAYYTLSNYEDTLRTVRIWEQLVAKYLYSEGRVPKFSNKNVVDAGEYDGAFVKTPVPGFYDWIVSYDLNSLYPHCEMQYNIGPETHIPADELPDDLRAIKAKYELEDLVEGRVDTAPLIKHNVAMAGNFEFYRRDVQSFFSAIKQDLYARRKEFKKKMIHAQQQSVNADDPAEKAKWDGLDVLFNNLQMAMKILLNSGYGALGNKHFLYYKIENAVAITSSGQLVNKWTYRRVNKLLDQLAGTTDKPVDRCAAGDTDSNYYTLADIVPALFEGIDDSDIQKKVDTVDQFCESILAPEIDRITDELATYINAYENKMVWEREVIAEKAIWFAKKHYVMSIWDSEGVRFRDKPKIKVMGVAAVKSSTPEWARKYLKECYTIALTQDQAALHQRLEEFREEYFSLDPSDIAIPRAVNNIEKYVDHVNIFAKGTPAHVKAALIHNHLIEEHQLKHIKEITSGDKIKYVMLKKPNPTGQTIIGFEGFLPKELGLHRYIDYGTIYDKAFRSPLHIFLDTINWTEEPVIELF